MLRLRESELTAGRGSRFPRSVPRPRIGAALDLAMQSGFHMDDTEPARGGIASLPPLGSRDP